MGNYLKKFPNGKLLDNEKSSVVASFCDEELKDLPEFNLIPEGLLFISVVDNGGFEAALVVDNQHDYDRVKRALNIGDERPTRYFLVKREWVRQMADKPLESDGYRRGGGDEQL
jgi:hypothetical protein